MTKITKEGLSENLQALVAFVYNLNMEKWIEYCNEHRSGKQDVEELTMFIRSITAPKPWRVIVSSKGIDKIVNGLADWFADIQIKMDENENIVSDTC